MNLETKVTKKYISQFPKIVQPYFTWIIRISSSLSMCNNEYRDKICHYNNNIQNKKRL